MFTYKSNKNSHMLSVFVILVITVVYTFPLLSQITTAIPGKYELTDVTEYVWSVGWIYHAISQGENIWHTDRLLVPYGADLRFNVFGLLQGLMAFPFVPILGVTGALNLMIVLTMFLNGITSYYLVFCHIKNLLASLLAAVCNFLSITIVWHFTLGRTGLTSLWLSMLSLILLNRLFEKPKSWIGVLLGFTLLATLLTDFHVVVFSVIWIFLYLLFYTWKQGVRSFTQVQVRSMLIAVIIFITASVYMFFPFFTNMKQGDFPPPSLDNAAYYSFSIEEFQSPDYIPYIYGFDFLILTILALMLFKLHGDYRFWLLASLFFLILSLGPYLKPTNIPLPYSVVSIWPPLQNFRAAYRFVIPATIGFTLVAGYVFKEVLFRISSRNTLLLICFVFFLLRTIYPISLEPFKTQVYPQYEFYSTISKDTEDYAILEIPFGIRSGLDQIGNGGERFQYYQHIHQKKLINGSLARLPVSLFDFYRSHPVLIFFSGDLSVDQNILSEDFTDVIGWSKIRYILIHKAMISKGQFEAFESFLYEQSQIQKIGIENDLVIYKVIPKTNLLRWRRYE